LVDVFDEVEEELRKERYQALLRQWGPWVGGAAAAIVVAVAGYQLWEWRSGVTADEASAQYMEAAEALAAGDVENAETGFAQLAESGPRGYAALALLRQGEIALQQGRADEAGRLFEQAAERAPDATTGQLARYKAALARFDGLSYDDLTVRLDPLTQGAAPFGALARELMGAAAIRDERWDEARSTYELLSVAIDAPPGVARRASEALVYIRQNAPAEPAAAAPDEPASDNGAPEAPSEESGR